VVLKDVGDGFTGRALNLLVSVEKRQIEARRKAAPCRRFTAAWHAHEHDRAGAEVGADGADRLRLRPFAFASCAESDHLCLVSPLPCTPTARSEFLCHLKRFDDLSAADIMASP